MKKQEIEGCIRIYSTNKYGVERDFNNTPDENFEKIFLGNFVSHGIVYEQENEFILRAIQNHGDNSLKIRYKVDFDIKKMKISAYKKTRNSVFIFDSLKNASSFFRKIVGFDYEIGIVKKGETILRNNK